jgi:hypothetical protein
VLHSDQYRSGSSRRQLCRLSVLVPSLRSAVSARSFSLWSGDSLVACSSSSARVADSQRDTAVDAPTSASVQTQQRERTQQPACSSPVGRVGVPGRGRNKQTHQPRRPSIAAIDRLAWARGRAGARPHTDEVRREAAREAIGRTCGAGCSSSSCGCPSVCLAGLARSCLSPASSASHSGGSRLDSTGRSQDRRDERRRTSRGSQADRARRCGLILGRSRVADGLLQRSRAARSDGSLCRALSPRGRPSSEQHRHHGASQDNPTQLSQ